MEMAASRPAATAAMAIYGPDTTSPPAYTSARLVCRVWGSASMRPSWGQLDLVGLGNEAQFRLLANGHNHHVSIFDPGLVF